MGKITKQVGDDWFALTDFTRYPNIRVNTNGRRFSNETDATLYSVHGAEIAMQPHQTEFPGISRCIACSSNLNASIT